MPIHASQRNNRSRLPFRKRKCEKLWTQPCAALLAVSSVSLGDAYRPLFSDEMLENADPETRARLEAIDQRNYQKWRADQARSSVPASVGRGQAGSNHGGMADSSMSRRQSGAMYQYRDAQGRIQFSDKPVAGATRVDVDVRTPDADEKAAYEAQLREQQQMLQYYDERNTNRAAEREVAARERAHQARCAEQADQLREYRRGGAVYYEETADGEREYLSESELESHIRDLEARYEASCGTLPTSG